MYEINYNLKLNSKEYEQKIFIDEKIVLTNISKKYLVYVKSKNSTYTIDFESKTLKLIDYTTIIQQQNQIIKLLGTFDIKESKTQNKILEFDTFSYEIGDLNNQYFSSIQIIKIPGLEETSYADYYEFEKQYQLTSIDLKKNEIIAASRTSLGSILGNQTQSLKLVSIKNINMESVFNINEYKYSN